jgi:cytochrome P450
MSDELDQLWDEWKAQLRRIVRQLVAEELEPFKGLLLKRTGDATQDFAQLVDAVTIAQDVFGFDISTDAAKESARQKVYYLAKRKEIPSVRISQRRIRFDLAAVRKCLAEQRVYRKTM